MADNTMRLFVYQPWVQRLADITVGLSGKMLANSALNQAMYFPPFIQHQLSMLFQCFSLALREYGLPETLLGYRRSNMPDSYALSFALGCCHHTAPCEPSQCLA